MTLIEDLTEFVSDTNLVAKYDDNIIVDATKPRKLYRHLNGKGTVIEFNMFGQGMHMFVPDAAYRPAPASWGMFNREIPELQNFVGDVKVVSNTVDKNSPMLRILTDAELQAEFQLLQLI